MARARSQKSSPTKVETAGSWDRHRWPAYFIAATGETLASCWHLHPRVLVPINEITTAEDEALLVTMMKGGVDLLIDSGVYALAVNHAKANDMSMNEALALPPEDIDGFPGLWNRYRKVIRRVGDKSWGYIEIDFGGRENKIRTRAKLEAEGFKPIPVYHPINDGWDYFDYLAERYDRICFGNIVMARGEQRRQLIATAWERRRKYPDLWIHLLGMTPNEDLNAWPVNSCDSSSWISGIRWGNQKVQLANKSCWYLPSGFTYRLGDYDSWVKGWQMSAYQAHFAELNMQTMARERIGFGSEDVGGDL